jgi:deferrochelatase/peroxidase EfeB
VPFRSARLACCGAASTTAAASTRLANSTRAWSSSPSTRTSSGSFVRIQARLAGEPMTDYITPVGGGYFFAPRGSAGPGDFVGSGAFTA